MSGWAPGDLALCVNDRKHGGDRCRKIRQGCVYTVKWVGQPADHELWGMSVPLLLEGVNEPFGHASERFRKINPHAEDAEDRETIRLLNGVPVDA